MQFTQSKRITVMQTEQQTRVDKNAKKGEQINTQMSDLTAHVIEIR